MKKSGGRKHGPKDQLSERVVVAVWIVVLTLQSRRGATIEDVAASLEMFSALLAMSRKSK